MRIALPALVLVASMAAAVEPPADLPRYDVQIDLNTSTKTARIRERIIWTNTAPRETKLLVVNFYPRYTVPKKDELLLAKTLELLRLDPSDGMISGPAPGRIESVRQPGGGELAFSYRRDNATAVEIELPQAVQPGERATVEIEAVIKLPNKQGRWGHWKGVHVLANALPTVAFYDADGWHAMPFVPWHQPFWNEAGIYTATMTLPEEQKLACSAKVAAEKIDGPTRTVSFEPFVGRDFTVVASADFREYTKTTTTKAGQEIKLTCLAFARHEFYAKKMLDTIADAIPIFANWFGPFPYDHFTIAESYFGWNGNESAGLVMIDERVFEMPKAGVGYVEYLVSHETCHQWWYNLVGNNGYGETFLDEGAATFFTHKMLDIARGPNNQMVAWDSQFTPRIKRENYRFSSMIGAIGREEMQPAAASLPEFGNLFALFTGAYDRGSKVYGLMEARLGENGFDEFIRDLVSKYSWRVLSAKQLQKELEDFTGKPWGDTFDHWVYGKGIVDWSVTDLRVEGQPLRRYGPYRYEARRGERGYPVTVELKQSRDYDEPTSIGFRFEGKDGFPIRVPIGTPRQTLVLDDYDLRSEPLGNGRVRVTLTLPEPPTDAVVDPDRVLLDADWSNNGWMHRPSFRWLPLYSMLEDSDLSNDYDRWNYKAGFAIGGGLYPDPWYTKSTTIGAKVGVTRTQQLQAAAYAGYRTEFNDLVIGAEGLLDHVPFPKTQVGFNYERRLTAFGDQSGANTANRAVLFGRYIHQQGSSLYLPPISYADLFTTYQDNFLQFPRTSAPGAERLKWSWFTGLHYRLNLLTPYWDPDRGWWLDLTYAAGLARLGDTVAAHQFRAELAAVQKLPDGLGYFSDIRLAGRGVVAIASPKRGEFFTLGGSTQFRGFDLAEQQGNFFWLANAEARLPVVRDWDRKFADSVIGLRNIWLAGFYDVGAMHANGHQVGDVAHALGVGVRVNVSFFSFIEQATVRFDVGKTINAATPFQFWFGVQHPF